MKKWLLLLPFLFLPFMGRAQVVGPGFVDYVTSAPSGSCSSNAHQRNVMGVGTVYTCQSGTWAQISGGGGGSCAQGACVVNAPTSDQAITGAHALILSDTGSSLSEKGSLAIGPLTVDPINDAGRFLISDPDGALAYASMVVAGGSYGAWTFASSQGTLGSPTASLSGDTLSSWSMFGYNGAHYVEGSIISSATTAAPNGTGASNLIPTRLTLQASTSADDFSTATLLPNGVFALIPHTTIFTAPAATVPGIKGGVAGSPLLIRTADDSAYAPLQLAQLNVVGASTGTANIVAQSAAGTPTLTLPTTTGTFATTATSPLVLNATTGALTCPTCNVTSSTAGGALTGTYPNPTIANLATGANPGPVPYVSSAGTLSEDATNFCWDATSHLLGVGTCSPTKSLDVLKNGSGMLQTFTFRNATSGSGSYGTVAAPGGGTLYLGVETAGNWTNGLLHAGSVMSQSVLQLGAGNSALTHIIQTNGHEQINTTTDPGGSIWLAVNGGIQGSTYNTNSNCANAASPAVCAAAPAGVVAVPTGTNPTLTINTTAVTANSNIFLQIDESSTIAATTCNTTLSTLVQPVVTARVAATSFTIQIGAVIASNPVCVSYHIIN